MTHIRSVIQDLIDRRLWPVALLLVAAVVATPILLGGGSDAGDDIVSVPPAPKTDQPADAVVAAIDARAGARVVRGGKGPDPFRKVTGKAGTGTPSVPATDEGGNVPIDVSPGGGAAPSGPPSGPDGSGGIPTPDVVPAPNGPGTPTTPRSPSTPSQYDESAAVNLRFGQTGAVKSLRGVAAFTPLPSAQDPFFVFEGVLRGTNLARFLVSEKVTATGDGKCRPKPTNCQVIDLQPGDSQYFDLKTDDGRSLQYQLDYVSKSKLSAKGKILLVKRSSYSARVRFGRTSAPAPARRLGRLAALGGSTKPVAQYLGVSSDRGAAVFALAPGTRLVSKEFCLDGGACRTIALARGASAVVSRGGVNHGIRVMTIERRQAKSDKLARLARHSASDTGRTVLRRMLADGPTAASIGKLRYSPVLGTVSRVKP